MLPLVQWTKARTSKLTLTSDAHLLCFLGGSKVDCTTGEQKYQHEQQGSSKQCWLFLGAVITLL